jgi:hypothetical protein
MHFSPTYNWWLNRSNAFALISEKGSRRGSITNVKLLMQGIDPLFPTTILTASHFVDCHCRSELAHF